VKISVLLLLSLAGGALIAQLLLRDTGYVLINFQGYLVELSVPLTVFLLALAYILVRLLVRAVRAPRKLGEAAGRIGQRRASRNFTRGLIEIAEGNWARAERMLTRGIRNSETPLLNYLAAARAAQNQGAYKRRDRWLEMAREQSPDTANAVLLTQAELQIDHRQYQDARNTLAKLRGAQASELHALALKSRIYRKTSDWESLKSLLPMLRKLRKKSAADDNLERDIFAVLMEQARANKDGEALDGFWKQIPAALRSELLILRPYFGGLIAAGRHGLEPRLRKAVRASWDAELIDHYGQLETKAATLIVRVEGWLTERSEDPCLLRTAGRLCMKEKLWGKARSYLETSIGIRPNPVTYQLYGQLLERLGESVAAADAFRLGLNLVSPADLPALENLSQS
jgi:HemY protein